MGTHWNAINDFMMGKYFHKGLYENYLRRPVHSIDFLAKPPTKRTFASSFHFMFIIPFLLFPCFLKFIFLYMYCECVILPVVSYVTSTLFRLQKETSCH